MVAASARPSACTPPRPVPPRLARGAQSSGNPRAARILLGRACLTDDPGAATAHLMSARGQLTEIQEHFEAGRALALLGHARTTGGDSTEAIAELERALDPVGTSDLWRARTLEWLGDAHQHQGDEATARDYWLDAAGAYETIRPADVARLSARAACP